MSEYAIVNIQSQYFYTESEFTINKKSRVKDLSFSNPYTYLPYAWNLKKSSSDEEHRKL